MRRPCQVVRSIGVGRATVFLYFEIVSAGTQASTASASESAAVALISTHPEMASEGG